MAAAATLKATLPPRRTVLRLTASTGSALPRSVSLARTSSSTASLIVSLSQGLSDVEAAHVQSRLNPDRFLAWLSSAGVSPSTLNLNLDSSSATSAVPHIAEIYSGGGYRAMISGSGGYKATSSFSSEAVSAGVAGIHNATIYAAGLRYDLSFDLCT